MDFLKRHFGIKLQEAIDASPYNQSSLSVKLGVKASSVSRWCGGLDFPDDDRLPLIYELLNIDEDYFLNLNSISESDKIHNLSKTEFKILLKQANKELLKYLNKDKNKSSVVKIDDPKKRELVDRIIALFPVLETNHLEVILDQASRKAGVSHKVKKSVDI